jgi:DNA primase
VEVLVATLPEGEDPDSLVRSRGRAALQGYLRDAVDVLERKIQILERRDLFGSISGTRRAVDALLPTVRAAADEVLRGVYVTRIAERTGVPRETIEREVAQEAEREAAREQAQQRHRRAEAQPRREAPVRLPPAQAHPERIILLLLLRDESMLERAARDLSPEDFSDARYRAVYSELLHAGPRDAEGKWLEEFPEEIIPLVEELRGDPEGAAITAAEAFYAGSVQTIQLRSYEARLAEIQREIRVAPPEEKLKLQEEQLAIRRTLDEKQLTGRRKHGMMRRPIASEPGSP